MGVDYNVLIENGTFTPSTVVTPQIEKFRSYKTGDFYNLAMNVIHGYFPAVLETRTENGQTVRGPMLIGDPPPPSAFNISNVDVRDWAIQSAAAKVDYIVLTVSNEYGFLLYPSEVDMPSPINVTRNGITQSFPKYSSYCVTGAADLHILDKVVYEFKTLRGIDIVMYFNGEWNWNQYPGNFHWLSKQGGARTAYTNACNRYMALIIQEVVRKYGIDKFWIDTSNRNDGLMPMLYNALKSVAPEGLLINNNAGNPAMTSWPFDVATQEEMSVYAGNTYYQTDVHTRGGVAYPQGIEIVTTPYKEFSQWYFIDEQCPIQPDFSPFDQSIPFEKMKLQNVNEFQGIVNIAKQYHRPFLRAILVDRTGTIIQQNLDYFKLVRFNVNNIRRPGFVYAKETITFFDAGVTADNMTLIHELGSSPKSYNPSSDLNSIDSFIQGKSYYLIPKKKVDLRASVYN